jgi:hypothetical protein
MNPPTPEDSDSLGAPICNKSCLLASCRTCCLILQPKGSSATRGAEQLTPVGTLHELRPRFVIVNVQGWHLMAHACECGSSGPGVGKLIRRCLDAVHSVDGIILLFRLPLQLKNPCADQNCFQSLLFSFVTSACDAEMTVNFWATFSIRSTRNYSLGISGGRPMGYQSPRTTFGA